MFIELSRFVLFVLFGLMMVKILFFCMVRVMLCSVLILLKERLRLLIFSRGLLCLGVEDRGVVK